MECPWRGTQHHPLQITLQCPASLAKLELMRIRKKLPLQLFFLSCSFLKQCVLAAFGLKRPLICFVYGNFFIPERERERRQHRTDIVLGLQMGRWFEKTTARFHLHSGPVFHIWVQRPSFVFCHRKPNLDCLKLEISLKTNPQGQQLHRFGG